MGPTGGAAIGAGFLFFVVFNIVAIMVTVVWSPFVGIDSNPECEITTMHRGEPRMESLPSWACGTILESTGRQIATGFSGGIGSDIIGMFKTVGTLFNVMFGFLALDYDILKGGAEIPNTIGWIIRIFAWLVGAYMLFRAISGIISR